MMAMRWCTKGYLSSNPRGRAFTMNNNCCLWDVIEKFENIIMNHTNDTCLVHVCSAIVWM